MVYVLPREKFLKDHVAALANNTAKVTNGEPLEVLDRGKRFIEVRTAKGETGWIEEATVATQRTADAFNTLASANKADSYIAIATVSSESRMHIHPGRNEPWLYLMEKDDKVRLLKRGIASRVIAQAMPAASSKAASGKAGDEDAETSGAVATPDIQMEDWWLVRDAQGHTGWVLARSIDVDVPDAMLKLGQGERFMGVYPLDTVHDAAAGMPGGPEVNEYAVAYAADHAGLLYDFDQVVVYTWNPRKHRYESAYRDRDMEGFLPLVVTSEIPAVTGAKKPLLPEPVFHYKVLADGGTITVPDSDDKDKDPDLGVPHPSALVEKAYRLEGVRVIPVGASAKMTAEAHPPSEKKSEEKKKK
jgi:hypothetical protein